MNGNDLLEYIICSTYDEQILKRPEIISAISYRKFPKFCNFANRLLLLWREIKCFTVLFSLFYRDLRIMQFALSTTDVSNEAR